MELQTIVERYAEGLAAVDAATQIVNTSRRSGAEYLPGLKTLSETQAVEAVDQWWADTYPQEFADPNWHATDHPYPALPRAACDHVFTTDGEPGLAEWAIEVKFPALVGNNGKRNDFAVSKMLSPYLKDRSLMHDVLRLRGQAVGRRQAVLGFSFGYDQASCGRARDRHPQGAEFIGNIEAVVRANLGALSIEPLLEFCDGLLRIQRLIDGAQCRSEFSAWRHPCGGDGVVFAWELSQVPDPHHPW